MVTQDIKSAVTSAEKVIATVDNLVSESMGPPSEEEIQMRQMANTTKKIVNETLGAAVSIEKAFTRDSSWGSFSDWGSKAPKQEERLW